MDITAPPSVMQKGAVPAALSIVRVATAAQPEWMKVSSKKHSFLNIFHSVKEFCYGWFHQGYSNLIMQSQGAWVDNLFEWFFFFYPKINWYFWLIFVIFILHGINLFFLIILLLIFYSFLEHFYTFTEIDAFLSFYTGFGFNISECNDILQAQYVYTAVT